MQIDVTTQKAGLKGGQEVWVHVLTNTYGAQWSDVVAKMSQDQIDQLEALGARQVLQFLPHTPDVHERAEHGYSQEFWWVWGPKSDEYNPILWNV